MTLKDLLESVENANPFLESAECKIVAKVKVYVDNQMVEVFNCSYLFAFEDNFFELCDFVKLDTIEVIPQKGLKTPQYEFTIKDADGDTMRTIITLEFTS